MLLCKVGVMATNLALDDDLINAAVTAGGHRSKKEAVTTALEEYLRLLKRRSAIELMGAPGPEEEAGDLPDRTFFDHQRLDRIGKKRPARRSRKSA